MLSLLQGIPIAAVCGGPDDGKILHLAPETEESDRDISTEDITEYLEDADFTRRPKKTSKATLRTIDQLRLIRALKTQQEPIEDYLRDLYHQSRDRIASKFKKEFSLSCGNMFVLPGPGPERVYIAGKSGCGKSCFAAMYMNEYLRSHPDSQIFLISRHDNEPAYAKIPHIPIPIETFDIAKEDPSPIELEDLKGSLVVFDDCDNLEDKRTTEAIKRLSHSIISNGRKFGIYCLWLNHQLMDYTKTRNLLNEANKVVIFNSGDNYHVTNYLKRYAGLGDKTIKKITAIKSRWLMLSTGMPNYIVHEHGALIL